MRISHRYADFGSDEQSTQSEESTDAIEDIRLAAFESGYQAGWEDAATAHAAETDKVTSEISQRLEDMSFTHREVYAKLVLALKPLMVTFVTKLLPDIAEQSLHAHILQEVRKLIDANVDGAIEIAVSPEQMAPLDSILENQLTLPFRICAEPSLKKGQVYLRVGHGEREIDLDTVLVGINEAVNAFFAQTIPEDKNG